MGCRSRSPAPLPSRCLSNLCWSTSSEGLISVGPWSHRAWRKESRGRFRRMKGDGVVVVYNWRTWLDSQLNLPTKSSGSNDYFCSGLRRAVLLSSHPLTPAEATRCVYRKPLDRIMSSKLSPALKAVSGKRMGKFLGACQKGN